MEPMNCCACPCGDFGVIGITLLVLAFLFDFILKGIALWRAGKNQQLGWFVALLIINSIGILPLLYLLVFNKKKNKA